MASTECGVCRQPAQDGFICWPCTRRLKTHLDSLPGLLAELDITISRQARTGTPQEGRSAEKPMPLHIGASDALAALQASIHGWCRCLSEDTEAAPSGEPHEWLAANIESLRMREWAPDALVELIGQRGGEHGSRIGRAWATVDLPPEAVFAGRCPCGATELLARPGASFTRCRACGQDTSVTDARDRMLASVADRWLPATQVAMALTTPGRKVTGAMVRGYKHRGQITARTNRHGQPTYRVGDIQALLAASDAPVCA